MARSVTTSAATALPAEDARDGGRGGGDHHRATSDENRADHDDGHREEDLADRILEGVPNDHEFSPFETLGDETQR